MRISTVGLEILRHYEQGPEGGPALFAYLDGGGVPTIGYGHTRGVKIGDTCTREQADYWLHTDCANAEHTVETLVTAPINQNQFDALVCFVFNIGDGQFHSSTLLRLLNAKYYANAAEQFKRWNKDNGKVVNGLVARRATEYNLFLKPV